jgi:hypothetical protein
MIWNKPSEKKPLATRTGMFDGKKSDKVLVADKFGKYHITFDGYTMVGVSTP